MKVAVKDLKLGDTVNIESCPYLYRHEAAPYELFTVSEIVKETKGCICVYYDYATCGYSPDDILNVVSREPAEERWPCENEHDNCSLSECGPCERNL